MATREYQSPVNIETDDVVSDETLGSLSVSYKEVSNSTLTNDGRTLQMTLTDQHQGMTLCIINNIKLQKEDIDYKSDIFFLIEHCL